MTKLVCAGGIYVPGDTVRSLEVEIDAIAKAAGFPDGDEFKWSPSRKTWMYRNLVGNARTAFFVSVLQACADSGASAIVCINDTNYQPATAATHEEDVTTLLLERADRAARTGCSVLVVMDRPGGNRAQEDAFVEQCVETVSSGTRFRKFHSLVPAPLCADSSHHRLLQAADVTVSATAAFVGGESNWSPGVFPGVRSLLRTANGTTGGSGLKLHPDLKFVNLYHWLLGDTIFWKRTIGMRLPMANFPYGTGADTP